MRLTLVTAVWQRHALTEVFWRWTAHLRTWWSDLDLTLVAVGSEDPVHERLATAAGAIYGDVPNTPLGRKWNLALKLARQTRPDAVLIMGSDDVFCEAVARAYRPYFTREPYVGLRDFYYLQTVDGRTGYFPGYRKLERTQEPTGSGRLIPAAYLQRLGWELWSSKPWFKKHAGYRKALQNHGIDHYSFRRLAMVAPPCPLITVRDLPGTALSCKGQGNLWQFEHTHPKPLPAGETSAGMVGRLPPDIVMALQAFREEARCIRTA